MHMQEIQHRRLHGITDQFKTVPLHLPQKIAKTSFAKTSRTGKNFMQDFTFTNCVNVSLDNFI